MTSCGGCHLADRCAGDPTRGHGPLRGVSLVIASLLYFLTPALLALLGAAVAGDKAPYQLLGGATGMLLGMLAANLAARRHSASLAREDCFEPR